MIFPYRRKWIRLAHCLLGCSLGDFRYLLVWLCHHIVLLTVFLFVHKNSTVLHSPFSPLLSIERLLEQLDVNLKGSIGLFLFLILELLLTLTLIEESILAAIFCCLEHGETLIIRVEGVLTFHCGSHPPGQEQSFFVASIAWVNSSFEKGLLYSFVWLTCIVFWFLFCIISSNSGS